MEFSIAVILSTAATPRRLYCENGMDDLYRLFDFLFNREHSTITIGLPVAAEQAQKGLMKQLPPEVREFVNNWEHSDNWREKIKNFPIKSVTLKKL